MRFFVPHVNDPQGQEELLRLIRGNVASQVGPVSGRRIHRVEFRRAGVDHVAEVGRPAPLAGDEVFAILEAADGSGIHVCTPSRGMFNDRPIVVPASEVVSVADFDP